MNRRHMTARSTERATLLVRAVDGVLGTHRMAEQGSVLEAGSVQVRQGDELGPDVIDRLLRQVIISMDLYLPRTTARYQAAERMTAL